MITHSRAQAAEGPSFGLPAWLARRPQHHRSAWLWWRGAARAWTLLPLLGVVLVLWLAALGLLLARWSMLAAPVGTLARHPEVLAAVAGVLALSAGLSRRQRLEHEALSGERLWVASLPSAASAPERIALPPLLMAALAALILALGALMQGLGWACVACALAVLLGALAGVLLALRLPRRVLGSAVADRPTLPASLWLGRRSLGTRASLLPLGRWPDGRKQAWSRPKVMAWGSFTILMSLPMPLNQTALGWLALWFAGHHLVTLLLALLATAFPAARWLAPTPLEGWRFAAFLSYRIGFKEALAAWLVTCAAMVVDAALGPSTAALGVLAWLLACAVLAAAACCLAHRPRVRDSLQHPWLG